MVTSGNARAIPGRASGPRFGAQPTERPALSLPKGRRVIFLHVGVPFRYIGVAFVYSLVT